MRVKRIVALNMQEAMEKIKAELGNDAVILHTRYFKEGGFLGLFRKNYVEVTAAVEDSQNEIPENLETAVAISGKDPAESGKNSNNDVNTELTEMRNMMKEMSSMLESIGQPRFPKIGQSLYQRLKKWDIEEKIAQSIVKSTIDEYAKSPLQTPEELNKIFFACLLKPIKKMKFIPAPNKRENSRILAFIGPTGVGKTTTIAKLAAMSAVIERKKVSLITVDTYRIAAVEQLKTVGEIMNVPVKVIFTPENLHQTLNDMNDQEMIYIDTAGRSHRNETQVEELKTYLENSQADDIFLVLSSTSKYQDLVDILETYQDINITSLIFTKLDETSNYGSIYNIACNEKYPISYFTIGQNIPDDIEIADPIKLVQLLIKE
ncbi:MAG: flagellar biosynthesis protein FlhF [Peptococcia bacterium]|jgi:flagellar biosynthesis protein FlhF